MPKTQKKLFVLDTNVILHDYNCINSFENNDIVIPITVLEEIDGFKHGKDQIHFNAREFIRILDGLSGDKLVNGGVSLGKGKGKIQILTNHQQEPEVEQIFWEKKPDHRILSVALHLTKALKERTVIFVSKDVNLRMKAKSLGITAQDYSTDRVLDIKNLYSGKRVVQDFNPGLIDRLYEPTGTFTPEEAGLADLLPNEYLILKNEQKSVLAVFDSETHHIHRVEKGRAYGIQPRNAEQTFALHALLNPRVQLVTLSGKAGTGKTLVALAAALEVRREFQQVFLARPIVPLSNRDLGYLPGDLEAKLDPYMQPLYDNLNVIKHQFDENDRSFKRIADLLENEKLSISPLAYIRGRHLERIFFIVDEAQNLTPHEVKTIITRAGAGTKVVFTGDPYQIDTPYLDALSNGLTFLIDRMKGQSLYAHITLLKGERSYLAELASDLL
ncbi:MAG: PhoH family protein [Acidobacteria bacterium]|nr:PhoH family protein [Acidobacteriota bacterium]MCG2816724.1 PhoH family protein [Candidatus Aminicenantes bacterium]